MDVLPVLKVLLTIFITSVASGSNLYLSLRIRQLTLGRRERVRERGRE